MDLQSKKMAVLRQISQGMESYSLKEILVKLGEGYSERSLRRWLADLVQEGLIEQLGAKKATRYKAVYYKIDHLGKCFSVESEDILKQIRTPLYERMPMIYRDEWIEAYEPNKSFYIPLELRLQLFQAGRRLKLDDLAGTYARQIYNRLLIDLSYNSSRLEGNTYSLIDTQKLLLEGASAEGKLNDEKIMILNHKEAIRYLVDTAPKLVVSDQTIYTIHYLLADGLLESHDTGCVRNQAVRVGGSVYIPFEDSKQLLVRLNRVIEKAAQIQDPYEQSLFLLIHISYLQAFLDVNKRTARLSANIPLIKNNLVPLSFNDIEREDYNGAMIAIYELQDMRPLLELYIFSYMRTCKIYDLTIKSVGYDEVRVRYRQQRRAIIREIILHHKIGKALHTYIQNEVPKLVKKEDQEAFIQDLMEDLKEINPNRIVGLGITEKELESWNRAQSL